MREGSPGPTLRPWSGRSQSSLSSSRPGQHLREAEWGFLMCCQPKGGQFPRQPAPPFPGPSPLPCGLLRPPDTRFVLCLPKPSSCGFPGGSVQFSSVQSLSHVQLFATPWTAARQASLSITNSWSLSKLMSIDSLMPSNHLILCRPLLLLPSIFPSIRVFSNESTLRIRWPKYWSFSFNISPSNEHPGLISFRMDWLDLLAVQGTLKSLLQHHSSKASILQRSAFFMLQLSHPYTTTRKTIALTRQSSVGKVMSLLLICCLGWS